MIGATNPKAGPKVFEAPLKPVVLRTPGGAATRGDSTSGELLDSKFHER